MKPLRLGMVGGGEGAFIGEIHRIASRLDNQFALVAGAFASDPERAHRSADSLGVSRDRSYADFNQMALIEAQLEEGIDAVVIVTPNHLHYAVASAFLKQGICVICDKPVTLNVQQALQLQQQIEQSQAAFFLTHNYTGYPLVRYAKSLIADGELGALRLVQVEYAQDWLSDDQECKDNKQAQWRTDPARSGIGGSLGDIGTHAINLAQFISGLTLDSVCADLDSFVAGRRLDDNAHIMLRYEQGVKGMLWCSQVAVGHANDLKIRIYGEKASIEWSQEEPNQLWFRPQGEPAQKRIRGGHGVTEVANRVSRTPAGHPEGYLEGFANLYTDIAQVLLLRKQGKPATAELALIPGIEEGLVAMKFVEAAVQSSQQNSQWTALSSLEA